VITCSAITTNPSVNFNEKTTDNLICWFEWLIDKNVLDTCELARLKGIHLFAELFSHKILCHKS